MTVSTESSGPTNEEPICQDEGGRDGYCLKNGTSMAAPLVTGIAGFIASWEPTLTTAQLKQLLLTWAVSDTTDGAAAR